MKKAVLLLLILLLSAASCAVNPVTGKKELSLISESQEIALGKQTDIEVRQQYGVYDDPAVNGYVQSIGQALVPHTHRPQLACQFAVLDTPVVNAFAVPGGFIYVTRGILALMNSEAELAVVLGHELGHVNARHSVRRMSEMMLVQVGLAVGSALSETFAKVSGVASVGIQLLFLKYSRDDERQADSLGVEYARKTDYNPGEMVAFFGSLQKLGDLSGGHSLPGFLSTHPLTSERIEKVKLMLSDGDKSLAIKDKPYLRQIDGLVYGDDPRQGYVEGNVFYHPELAFSFAIPSGWTVQNTPTQVALVSKDEKAALLLQAEKSAENLPEYIKKRAAAIEGSEYVAEDHLRVAGLTSYHQIYQVNQQNGRVLGLRLSAIRKGPYIYTFTAMAATGDFKRYNADFRQSPQSFAELRNPAFLQRKPLHVELLEAGGGQTLQEIFTRAGVKKDQWPTVAILNGIELQAKPQPGRIVKIVR
jgi:predicted Zn-dependent protease